MKKKILFLFLCVLSFFLVSCKKDECEIYGHDTICVSNNDGTHTLFCNRNDEHILIENCHFGEWELMYSPSTFVEGLEIRKCILCDFYETRVIPQTHIHEYSSDWEIDVFPTCSEYGYKSHHCVKDNCSSKIDVTKIEKIDHDIEYNYSQTSTCLSLGYDVKEKCKNCSYINYQNYQDYADCMFDNGVCIYCGGTEGLEYQIYEDEDGKNSYSYVKRYTGTSENVIIKESYKGYPVKEIAGKAFYKCMSVKSVYVPDSIEKICKSAFMNCDNLIEINLNFIGEKKEGTGETHFGYIFGADSYNLNNEYVPTTLKKVIIRGNNIKSYAFEGCEHIEEIEIVGNVNTLNYSVFQNCKSLKSIKFPESLESIKTYAFAYCENLTEIEFPDNLSKIDDNAFYYCSALETVYMPNNLNSIYFNFDEVFNRCDNLKFNVYENISYIGSKDNPYMILHSVLDKSLIKYTIHSDTKFILEYSFQSCYNLEKITIPKNITYIGARAFSNCSSLRKVYIPTSVKKMGEYVFYNCLKISMIFCEHKERPNLWNSRWNYLDNYNSIGVQWGFTISY